MTAAQKQAVVEGLAAKLAKYYIFPDVAQKAGEALKAKLAKGGYDGTGTKKAFMELLSEDLRTFGNDRHFRVRFDPEFKEDEDDDKPPTAKERAELQAMAARRGYGIAKAEILPGNVGLLDLRGFGPAEFVGPALSAAMTMLHGTEAFILDLRQNGGGSPETVAFLCSYFFDEGDNRHLNDIYNRPKDRTRQFWTVAVPGPRYGGTKPVWVLTSGRTFSGGEECAYDFQTQKRAVLVGETTGGGANPGGPAVLGEGFVAFIPTGKAVNPVTRTNWEHVGVKPDVAVPAADALKVAHGAALRKLAAAEKDPEAKARLEARAAKVEKGEQDPPRYTR
jgi:C-terminal processing protease CtpA/Prc